MTILFVLFVCLAVAAPLVVAAWAMRPQHCRNCGATVEPDPRLLAMFIGD
jgi:hypothetical protein